MPIKFACPNCKKNLTAKDEQAGKKVACPACKKPLTIPKPARHPAARASAPAPAPEDVEAAAAALLSDVPSAGGVTSDTIDFTCEYCDAAVSLPAAEGGKRVPCPECRRILQVPMPAKQEQANWRNAGAHLPSAAKRPDEAAPEGAWGNLTKTVVSLEALEEADAIPEKVEPLTVRQRVVYWSRVVVGATCVTLLLLYSYNLYASGRERRAAAAAAAYAADPETLRQIGRERVGALHTLAGMYYLRTRVMYSDSPLSKERGSAEQARDEFGQALKTLQGADPHSAERDAALGDLALAMAELSGDRDEVRDRLKLKPEECLQHVRAALVAIHAPEARLDTFRTIARRMFARGLTKEALALSSTAFSESPGERMAARAIGQIELLEHTGDKEAAAKACDEMLKEYEDKKPPPLAAEVVALAVLLGKQPPPAGKSTEAGDSTTIGEAEGFTRKGQLPQGKARAEAAGTPQLELRALVAVGAAAQEGGLEALSAACQRVKRLPNPAADGWVLLRLVRLGARAGVADAQLETAVAAITDPAIRGRAKLELLRAKLEKSQAVAGTDLAEAVDPQTPAGALAYADLARHNGRFDGGYLRTAESWPAPLWAFGTLGALQSAQKDDN
jgi:tetratricopeptide (TPR) repeat protein/DNA-directed RNA polymerase subunit RPC12/RpoP